MRGMRVWKNYRRLVESNLRYDADPELRSVDYWRNRLFSVIVVYTLPVCMIAYVPAMVACYVFDFPGIAFYDTLAIFIIVVLTFSRRLTLKWKKILFVATMYILSISLLYYMGVYGPGLLYLLSSVIFVSLIYSSQLAYICIVVNLTICLLFAVAMHYNWADSPMIMIYTAEAWLVVASNQVLLSLLFAMAIHMLTSGLRSTLDNERRLKEEIRREGAESERLVKELSQKNEELEQFAYIASHDLQEPLNTISGIVEVLKLEGVQRNESEYKQSLGFIYTSVERLRSLIKGLLDYSRIGRQLLLETVECHKLLHNVLNDLHASITESKAQVVVEPSIFELPPLRVYPLEFNQLFQNLISNAIKFRKPQIAPEISIGVEDEGDFHKFHVSDNGIGIDEHFLQKVFVIFKRAHARSAYEGTGIGLAFCKKIVELHEGTISVSSSPGAGSCFVFTIAKHISHD